MDNKNKKEVARKKSLGELGELFALKALVDKGYKVSNVNDIRMNYPFADLLAEKDDHKYIVSVKSRNKFQKNNTLNAYYKLGEDVYDKAALAQTEFGATPYWMAVQFDTLTYSVYFGPLHELNGKKPIPINKCMSGEIGECLVPDKRHYFDYFKNEKDV